MNEPNYKLWRSINEFRLSDVGYLWCGYDPPPDIDKRASRPREITGHRVSRSFRFFVPFPYNLEPKPLPGIVSVKLRQILAHIGEGKLQLKTDGGMSLTEISSYGINCDTINGLSKIILTRQQLIDYATNLGERPKFLFFSENETETRTSSPSKQRELKKCGYIYCGKSFVPKNGREVFCSKDCRTRHYKWYHREDMRQRRDPDSPKFDSKYIR